jgi:RNA polymerase sigma-70 factor (ECF subfamily)
VRPPTNDASDAELLRIGDADTFTVVYDRHIEEIFAWARSRVGDYAADLTAEVFARAWRDRKRFRDQAGGSAFPWLLGIARNVLRDSLRKRQVETCARARLGLPIQLAADPGYEAVDERLSFPSAVMCAFANMPEPDRELLVLRLVEDRSYREIAVRMNCTSVAARRRFSRSFRRLRLTLGGVQL